MGTNYLNNVSAEILIDNKSCDFLYMELHQTMSGHHLFRIDLHHNPQNNQKQWWTVPVDQVLGLLKKSVQIKLTDPDGGSVDFEGVISQVEIGGRDQDTGISSLYGGSPTLLMTDDYTSDSFSDTDVVSVVEEVFSGLGLDIKCQVDPLNNCEIPYICRYQESSYNFLNRFLASCGEWFYYDGHQIVVGKPQTSSSEPSTTLSYTHDLIDMRISSSLGCYNVEQYDYDPSADRIDQWCSAPDSGTLGKFARQAFEQSKDLFTNYTFRPGLQPITRKNFNLMESAVNAAHFGRIALGATLTARTRSCKPTLGSIVSIDIDPDMNKYDRELGDFRIIEITHRFRNDTTNGAYENQITGIDAAIEYIPAKGVVYPTAMPEVATVIENEDPKHLRRVKVQFIWQQAEEHLRQKSSNWIRVQTPDGGSSDAVEKDRGFGFTPEVGDQVMVGYEYGDPSRPFVMGSLFHGNNTEGAATGNGIRTLRTRSGHTLEFNDDEQGDWGITIRDRNGCLIHIDTKGKNMEISAPETLLLSARNMKLQTSENLSLASEGTLDAHVSQDATFVVESKLSVEAGSELTVKSDAISQQSKEIELESSGPLTISGGQTTQVKGKKIQLHGQTNKLELP